MATAALVIATAGCGGLGALARFALDALVSRGIEGPIPWGTFAVNVSGALALGVLVGASVSGPAQTLAETAALGSYTTFSTWLFEAHRACEDGQARWALANLALSLLAGLGAVALGRAIA